MVGARPQFVKLAPVAAALAEAGHEHVICHTGQHYDPGMSQVFFDELGIPAPDVHLEVGSESHGRQTGRMLAAMDEVLERFRPTWVLVYGDTNSTLAGALSAVKMHLPLAHLEAGLRSFNRRMPEEHNRVLTDHAADLCLAPTEVAMGHLRDEGLADRAVLVGDVMTDVCLRVAAEMSGRRPDAWPLPAGEPYLLATIHRADNTDDPDRLRAILESLHKAPLPVVLTAHPRLRARAEEFGLPLTEGSLRAVPPLDYAGMMAAVRDARAVVTDSGGLQKEAFLLRTPCVTVRTETEWTETVDLGWNRLVPDPSDLPGALSAPRPPQTDATPYGDGHSAPAVVRALGAARTV